MKKTPFNISLPYKNQSGICPCYGCGERESGCHSYCQRYVQWHKNQEEMKEKRRNAIFLKEQAEYRRREAVAKNIRKYK